MFCIVSSCSRKRNSYTTRMHEVSMRPFAKRNQHSDLRSRTSDFRPPTSDLPPESVWKMQFFIDIRMLTRFPRTNSNHELSYEEKASEWDITHRILSDGSRSRGRRIAQRPGTNFSSSGPNRLRPNDRQFPVCRYRRDAVERRADRELPGFVFAECDCSGLADERIARIFFRPRPGDVVPLVRPGRRSRTETLRVGRNGCDDVESVSRVPGGLRHSLLSI